MGSCSCQCSPSAAPTPCCTAWPACAPRRPRCRATPVSRGAAVGYLDPNGAGKSTTIRILLDLARPDDGEVRVLGADPRRTGPPLRRRIGDVPGELRLDDRLRSWARHGRRRATRHPLS